MIRYIDRTDTDAQSLEISFVGMEWEDNGKKIDKNASVSIRLLERNPQLNNDIVPYVERWTKEVQNILVPTGVWHGIKLGVLANGKAFVALGESICELSLINGNVVWKKEYANTSIMIIILAPNGEGLYVLYTGYQFKGNNISSNLIKIGFAGNFIWSAKPKQLEDSFTSIRLLNNSLFANTWDGWYGYIDDNTGEMINPEWTK